MSEYPPKDLKFVRIFKKNLKKEKNKREFAL